MEYHTKIFSDGSSLGNPGPGGWGALILSSEYVTELGDREEHTTNNRMELTAATEALRNAPESDTYTVYTDSKYVIQGITGWIHGWKMNNWMTKNKTEVLNRDLWEKLSQVVEGKNITWEYVAGHVGVPGNERVDTIAQRFAGGEKVELYEGLRIKYPIEDIEKIPDMSEQKAKKKGGKAYSYLSLVDGSLQRHETWSECKARVTGKSNVRFKKALSKAHEQEILEEWGLM